MSGSYDGLRIPVVAAERLAAWGEHPVIRELQPGREPRAVSAADYRSRINELAAWLRTEGVGENTVVALFLENSIDHLVVLFALFELGAVPVIAKLEYRSIELDEIFENADPAVVATETGHLDVLAPYLEGRHVIERGAKGFRTTQQGPPVPRVSGTASAGDRLRAAPDVPAGTASINYTYRGLGYPVGALVTHAQYLHGADILQDGLYGYPGESMMFSIPISHIFTLIGCVLVPLRYGMTAVIARTIHPRMIFEYFDTYGIEHVTAVPEIYRLLHRALPEGRRFPGLRTFVSGGSLLAAGEHGPIAQAFDLDFLHGYGLTEFTPASRNIRGRARAGTIGPVCGGVECRIAEGGLSESADGSVAGEVLLRTNTMSGAYYRRPEVSRQADAGGWFRTGDIGRFEDGHLIFEREHKRTCKVGGVMVDLEEVEKALLMHPEVHGAHVEFRDGALEAGLEVQSSADFEETLREIRAFLKPRIAAYKVPRRFYRP
ncbi:MAG: AMP-binding protein [Spirochaetes bacterium]|jgi:long-chain acyl-CoA synthetase|nr:AMP-binding protein [Spirochaetota bacterium]